MIDIEHDAPHAGQPQSNEGAGNENAASGGQIIIPSDVLPATIHVLPQEQRPFFPGQAVPLIMDAERWMPVFKALQDSEQDVVGIVCMRESSSDAAENPKPADLYEWGTVCRIHRIQKHEDQLHVLLEGLQRFHVQRWIREQPLMASVRYYPEKSGPSSDELKAYAVAVINTIKELIPLNPLYGEELKIFLSRSNPNQPAQLADFAATLTTSSRADLQELLETLPLQPRLEKALELLHKEVKIARTQMEIREHVEKEIQNHQREALLQQQLKYIQKELGISKDDKTAEIDEFRGRLEKKTVPEAVQKRMDDEFHKLQLLETGSAEYGVTRNYLDWLTALPWGVLSTDTDDLGTARSVLDASHDGLDDVKARIVEFLALGIMRGTVAGSIILLVGPPGVGKTSLGRSIADALGREFYRFSVGGMRDEAEIKGHRRTYIGAMPGKLAQALKDTGTANPVVMLDEIDKIGASFQGDPASALLEVLDPEQNSEFLDHYLDVRMDLSKVLFVCTANQLDTIPPALLDRMDTIHLSGYLDEEKLAIASHHLLPRQLQRAGIDRKQLSIDKSALRTIIDGYAREAGVRRLEKQLATVVRKGVVKLLEDPELARIRVQRSDLPEYLGKPTWQKEQRQQGVGVVTGLAWTAAGGATLPVEATCVHSDQSGFRMTGQLGDVMKESASIANSFVTANAQKYGVKPEFFSESFIHLHVPAGATPKDGPSAGVTMATALISLATGRRPKNMAMTGELTLTGHVYPIGGVREKLLAARRQKIKEVILPAANERDFAEVPEHIVKGLTVHFAAHYDDVFKLMFP